MSKQSHVPVAFVVPAAESENASGVANAVPAQARSVLGEHVCVLTGKPVVDGVLDGEGNVYERAAILELLRENGESPVTGNPLAVEDLVPLAECPELCTTLVPAGDAVKCLVQVLPPVRAQRMPVHICCVIDVSGSMGVMADVKGDNGVVERSGLNNLDLVKHAVRTILATLEAGDRLSIVSFSDAASVVSEPVLCTPENKKLAQARLEAMGLEGSTNLWDGVRVGLDLVKGVEAECLHTVFVLTDGYANVTPPRGTLETMARHMDLMEENGTMPCSVNTFAFGYQTDSPLLRSMAARGRGMFAFIPDAGMVGTVFIHAAARALSALAEGASLSIEVAEGAKLVAPEEPDMGIVALYGGKSFSWGHVVPLGTLGRGLPRTLVFAVDPGSAAAGKPLLTATLSFTPRNGVERRVQQVLLQPAAGSAAAASAQGLAAAADGRVLVMELLRRLSPARKGGKHTQEPPEARAELQAWVAAADAALAGLAADAAGSPRALALLSGLREDVKGQVTEAVETDAAYKRWGFHFLGALLFAHQLETCTNFKDPGMQLYASDAGFQTLRDTAEAHFTKLPPPKPSSGGNSFGRGGGKFGRRSKSRSAAAPLTQQRMASLYLNRARGCFGAECQVHMADGSRKRFAELRKGDRVLDGTGAAVQVACVVKTRVGADADMVRLPTGALLTPYHPVRVAGGAWAFPCELAPTRPVACEAVYNMVLADGGSSVLVNGVAAVTLGHGIEGRVVGHPYFGSRQVVADLAAKASGFASGFVELLDGAFVRDPASDLVNGLDSARIVQPAAFSEA